jgi:NhaA family Na+:H+ antiporter
MTRHIRIPVVGRALWPVGSEFVSVEALGGTVLLAATVAAFVWANVADGSYDTLWGGHLTVGWGQFALSEDLRHWVNNGLMTLFFFVVGIEIKRELVRGDLRDRRRAALPVLAAFGGMLVPTLLYTAVNAGGSGGNGWAIPMATDIAFAIVVLSILGSRVPHPLKLFLLTLAVVDDIGAIVVIALFYSTGIAPEWLLGAAITLLLIVAMQRLRIGNPIVYVVPALVLWVCTQQSGVHATIAGVVLGLLTPARSFQGREVIEGLEHRLHPWSSLLVIPLFAIANAGVHLDRLALDHAATSRIAWGVILGLVIGKPLGIVTATVLGQRLRLGKLPDDLTLRHVVGAVLVAGIGFTVSLFVADLAFQGAALTDAKVGIVTASVVSGIAGAAWLWRAHSPALETGADPREAVHNR